MPIGVARGEGAETALAGGRFWTICRMVASCGWGRPCAILLKYFMTRRTLLKVGLAGIPAAAYAHWVEPEWLAVREYHLKWRGPKLTFAHVSDLHASAVVRNGFIEEALETTVAQRPEFICMTGDWITHNTGYDAAWYARTLAAVTKRVPVFGTLGNHDGGAWSGSHGSDDNVRAVMRFTEDGGVTMLENRSVVWNGVRVVGLGDVWAERFDPDAGFREHQGLPTLLLSHNPDTKAHLEDRPFDLMLSGHTHGGQVVVPGIGLSPAPVRDRRFVYGLRPWQGRLIHISAGVGNALGVRFNCRPEITIFHMDS